MREIVLDTETTGLNYKSGHRIIEVGCVELINHVSTGKSLQFYCNVEKNIDDEARRIHGITNEFLKQHPTFREQSEIFLDFIKNDTLIIHNSNFDLGFLNNELRMLGISSIGNKVIDTVALARKNLNTRIVNLDYLCRRFSIDLKDRDLHGALLDSQLLAEVYLELKGGKQISMNLASKTNNSEQQKKSITLNKSKISKVSLNNNEIALHKERLKQVKNPLWQKINY